MLIHTSNFTHQRSAHSSHDLYIVYFNVPLFFLFKKNTTSHNCVYKLFLKKMEKKSSRYYAMLGGHLLYINSNNILNMYILHVFLKNQCNLMLLQHFSYIPNHQPSPNKSAVIFTLWEHLILSGKC